MRLILTFDLDDASTLDAVGTDDPAVIREDVEAAIRARLDEVFVGPDGFPVIPERVRVAVTDAPTVDYLLDAALVGLDGSPEEDLGDAAWTVTNTLAATDEVPA